MLLWSHTPHRDVDDAMVTNKTKTKYFYYICTGCAALSRITLTNGVHCRWDNLIIFLNNFDCSVLFCRNMLMNFFNMVFMYTIMIK